ncbi:AIR synthase-related protein [Roseburia hominis]
MNLGNVSQTVYRRSVLKQLHKESQAVLVLPGQEEECWGVISGPGESVLASDVTCYGNEKDLCVFAMAQAANNLASRGAQVKGFAISILLTDYAHESRLKAMMQSARQAAEREGLAVMKAHAQTMPLLQTTVVQVTALGTISTVSAGKDKSAAISGKESAGHERRTDLILSRNAEPEQDLVMIKWAGLEGTLRIKREKEEELSERFPGAFLNKLESYMAELFSIREMKAAAATGVSAMHQITDGGVLAALWNLAESAGIGLSVDLRKIPIRQETIEVCEQFHLNPYQLTSTGSILVVTQKGEEMADALKREGTAAAVIGYTTRGRERTVRSGSELRYLDRPAPDELTKIFA